MCEKIENVVVSLDIDLFVAHNRRSYPSVGRWNIQCRHASHSERKFMFVFNPIPPFYCWKLFLVGRCCSDLPGHPHPDFTLEQRWL